MSFDLSRLSKMLAAVILVAFASTACGPSLTPQPQRTPVVVRLQHTPALTNLRAEMNACMSDLTAAGLVVEERSPLRLDLSEADVALRWDILGQPPAFAAVIAQEELVFVAHLENPRESISVADVQSIYSGGLREWPEAGKAIVPYTYPAGDDAQLVFESIILGGSAVPDRVSYLVPDPGAMIEAVAGEPNALGFLPRRWLDARVKELPIEDIEPEFLRRPLVALAEAEPTGPARDWLFCLQERLK